MMMKFRMLALPELAILASPTIDARECRAQVALVLTRNTGSNARHGLTTTQRNRLATFVAFLRAFARRHPGTSRQHSIRYRIINLILHRPITRPSIGHLCFQFNCFAGYGSFFQQANAEAHLSCAKLLPPHLCATCGSHGTVDRAT